MSIANYGELKQALYTLFKRADIDSEIQIAMDTNTAELGAAMSLLETKGNASLSESDRDPSNRRYYYFTPLTQDTGLIFVDAVYYYPGDKYIKLREQHRRSIFNDWEHYPQGDNKYLETWAQDEDGVTGVWFNIEPAENSTYCCGAGLTCISGLLRGMLRWQRMMRICTRCVIAVTPRTRRRLTRRPAVTTLTAR